jgi:hypothetical protein
MEQLVSSMRQDSTSASNPTRTENMAREANSQTRDDSPADSSHSTAGTTQGEHSKLLNYQRVLTDTVPDPIILSDDEPEGAESGTDYSDLDFDLNIDLDLTTEDGSRSLHNPDSWLAGDDDFDSGTTFNSSHLAAECHNNDSNNGDGVIDTAKRLRSAGRPRPVSPRAATYQTSKLQVNTEGTKRSADHIDNGVFSQLEDDAFDVFAKDDNVDSDDAHSRKRRKLTTISLRDLTLNSAIPKLPNRRDNTQSPQPGLAAAGPQQIEFKSAPLRELRRRGVTRRDLYKRLTSPVKLATTATTASAALKSTELEEPPSGSPVAEPNQELEIGNIVGQKRVRWAEDKEDPANTTTDDVEEDSPISSVDVPSRAVAATLSGAEQESEEIAVHGYLILKTHQSQVLYCLTFSQESLPRPLRGGRQQDVFIDQSERVSLVAEPNQEWTVRKIIGQKIIDEEMHYQVVWEPTWVPESELAGAKELVDGFVAKSQHPQAGIGAGRGKQAVRAAPGTSRQPDAQGRVGPPKRRGRPRKQK